MRAFASRLNEILLIGTCPVLIGVLALARVRDLHRRPTALPAGVSEAETARA